MIILKLNKNVIKNHGIYPVGSNKGLKTYSQLLLGIKYIDFELSIVHVN